MALSKNIHTYADVHQVLTTALEHGGGIYTLDNESAARYWQMRANNYRKLLRESSNINTFDNMRFRLDKDNPCMVIIELNTPMGVLTSLTGKKLDPGTSTPDDILPKPGLTNSDGKSLPATEAEAVAMDLAERLKSGKLFDE